MNPVKRSALIMGVFLTFAMLGPRWSAFLSLVFTLVLAGVIGIAMTTIALAGESLNRALPPCFFLGIQLLLCGRHEIVDHVLAVVLGLGLGSASAFAGLWISTVDPSDEE